MSAASAEKNTAPTLAKGSNRTRKNVELAHRRTVNREGAGDHRSNVSNVADPTHADSEFRPRLRRMNEQYINQPHQDPVSVEMKLTTIYTLYP